MEGKRPTDCNLGVSFVVEDGFGLCKFRLFGLVGKPALPNRDAASRRGWMGIVSYYLFEER